MVANGHVYVGSNNGAGYLKRYPATVDLGVLLCFDERDGKFLWQHSNEKLPTGRVHDWPLQGVCAASLVEGERLWYVSNRGEVVCLDTQGFYDDEDDGPVTKEPAKLFELARGDDPATDKVAGILAALKQGKVPTDLIEQCQTAGLEVPQAAKVEPAGPGFKLTFTPSSGVPRELVVRPRGRG